RGVLAFSRADRLRRKDVQVQGHGPRPGRVEPAVRNRCNAILPGFNGGTWNGYCAVGRPFSWSAQLRQQDLERGAVLVHELRKVRANRQLVSAPCGAGSSSGGTLSS